MHMYIYIYIYIAKGNRLNLVGENFDVPVLRGGGDVFGVRAEAYPCD
jgi:hypothetical protein